MYINKYYFYHYLRIQKFVIEFLIYFNHKIYIKITFKLLKQFYNNYNS